MTRVIHTGDTHLGYRQYHSPERRRDYVAAFERVVEDAIDDDVDAVVHAGDLYHDRRPALGDLLATISILRTLSEAGIPFLAIVGNHESTHAVRVGAGGPRRDAQWLDLFETLGLATRLDAGGTVVGDTAFYGLDHVPRSKRDALDYEFAERDATHAALVSHGLFTPFDGGNWDLEAVLEQSNVAFDAVLLGDNHDPGIEQVGGAWATYCGSTERTSASERADRGYNIVTFEEEVRISRRGIETRPFVFVDLELHEGEGVGVVRERIREEPVADAVVVVTLSGDGEPVTPAEVETFGEEQGALVTRVNDRRELAGPEADVAVSFADPDEAVRRRVREMGLSAAARRVDRTVRDDAVADSNVRSRVDEAVRELLEEDPGAFERVPDPDDGAAAGDEIAAGEDDGAAGGDDAERESAGDAAEAPSPEAAGADASGRVDGTEPATADDATGEATAGEADGATAAEAADDDAAGDGYDSAVADDGGESPTDGEAPETATDEDGAETADPDAAPGTAAADDDGDDGAAGDDSTDDSSDGTDGQATMEEYL